MTVNPPTPPEIRMSDRRSTLHRLSPSERLVRHVHTLESLIEERQAATAAVADAYAAAGHDGFDPVTIKAVIKLRTLTPLQREERRALEAVYLASLGMLEGEALPDAARRRLDGQPPPAPPTPPSEPPSPEDAPDDPPEDAPDDPPADPPAPPQPSLPLKDPEEARQEGRDAAAAGARIYDNPYRAGDPCRAAWDEGWCAQKKSHGMEPPAAFQRKVEKPPKDAEDDSKGGK